MSTKETRLPMITYYGPNQSSYIHKMEVFSTNIPVCHSLNMHALFEV